jgi:hypothetical protein
MKKIFAIITLAVISLVGLAQNNTVVWANGELIQDAVADSLFLYESEWADTVHLLIPKVVVREVHKTVYIHDTIYIESSGSSDNTETSGMENGHEWVDLGLSVKWATCNVGAMQPEEYGGYFAWGEVDPKVKYDWDSYKHHSTKYTSSDNKTILDPEDDAATVNWGGSWRMPTKEEFDELINNCTWTLGTLNGVDGYNVTGSNGNSIFLPAAGTMADNYQNNEEYGCYWLSLVDSSSRAYHLCFGINMVEVSRNYRKYGLSVRPVFK